jgi:C-8 sterol isomerase
MAPPSEIRGRSAPVSPGPSRLLTIVGIVLAVVVAAVYYVERNLESFYIFDKAHLLDLSNRAIQRHGNDTTAMVDYIVQELYEKHPNMINPRHDDPKEWMFNNHGGAMGSMYIIHASQLPTSLELLSCVPTDTHHHTGITEYLIIYGTALGTDGHSGRHTADDYFHILSGEERAYKAGAYTPEIYKPGTVHHLPRGTVKQYQMSSNGWALELASGWIPPMLFFGYADGLTSTLDVETLWRTTALTAREMGKNLLRGKF